MAILDDYLNPLPTPHGNLNRWSCFIAALRDARATTGRDTDTGAVVAPGNTSTWIGATGYLCFLDQVGTAVQRTDNDAGAQVRLAQPGSNSFTRCLVQFSDLDDRHVFALYALRCALAHDFSLINKHNNNQLLRHRFGLVPGGNHLITFPDQPWDGDFPGVGGSTVVNIRAVGDLAEQVVEEVIGAHQAGVLETAVPTDEFEQRYCSATGTLEIANVHG